MITHDHGLSVQDDAVVRQNWETTQLIADEALGAFRDSRDGSCAPWCVPVELEEFLLACSQYEIVALVHALMAKIIDREDLDRGYNPPGGPEYTSFNNKI